MSMYLECWYVNVLVFHHCHKDVITGTYRFIITVSLSYQMVSA